MADNIDNIDDFQKFLVYENCKCFMLRNLGAAYGTARSNVGILIMVISKPELNIKSIIPVIMEGILGIYGLIVPVILNQNMISKYSLYIGKKYIASVLLGSR